MEKKQCSGCKKVKPITVFHKGKGKDGFAYHCKQCALKHNKSSRKANRVSYNKRRRLQRARRMKEVSDWKESIGCYICEENDPCAIDLHHLDKNEKDIDPSSFIQWGLPRFAQEAEKCVPLCATCHRKVHHKHISLIIDAGWRSGYLATLIRWRL